MVTVNEMCNYGCPYLNISLGEFLVLVSKEAIGSRIWTQMAKSDSHKSNSFPSLWLAIMPEFQML